MAIGRLAGATVAVAVGIASTAAVAPRAAAAGSIRQVDVSYDGSDTPPFTSWLAEPQSMSADGRLVAFVSSARNIVDGDDDGIADVFVRDVVAGATTLVSVLPDGIEHTRATGTVISGDGRYVAFTAYVDAWAHVWRHDRVTGTTGRVTTTPAGTAAVYGGEVTSISDDGRFVAFVSRSPDLAPEDGDSVLDQFVRDMERGRTVLAGVGPGGADGAAASGELSATGRFIAFAGVGFTPGIPHRVEVFRRDLVAGTTVRVSSALDGGPASADSGAPTISDDGRFVAFESSAGNLVAGDPVNHIRDVFVRDVRAGTTVAVGVGHDGRPADGASSPSISGDGRYVAFDSTATNLVEGDVNGQVDVFVRDMVRGRNVLASARPDGTQADAPSRAGHLDATGRTVVFTSEATNLVPGHDEPVVHLYHRRLW